MALVVVGGCLGLAGVGGSVMLLVLGFVTSL